MYLVAEIKSQYFKIELVLARNRLPGVFAFFNKMPVFCSYINNKHNVFIVSTLCFKVYELY